MSGKGRHMTLFAAQRVKQRGFQGPSGLMSLFRDWNRVLEDPIPALYARTGSGPTPGTGPQD